MATQIKIKPEDQADLDELNALNSASSDQADLDELNALNADVSPMAGIKALSPAANPILNALDLERRYASPAAAFAAVRPDLLEESERGSGFGEGQAQFPPMSELLNRRAAKMGETPTERAMNQPLRTAGGFLADMMTPSMALTLGGASVLKNAPKAIQYGVRGYEALSNPVGELLSLGKPILEKGGNALYRQPFKAIDATADVREGVRRISELAKERGITGDYRSIIKQLRQRLAEEGKTIESTIGDLSGKISGGEIMDISADAAKMRLGDTVDRQNILNFIDREIENMTPESLVAGRAKFAADTGNYNEKILNAQKRLDSIAAEYGEESPQYVLELARQEEQFGRQGTLFERPKTEQFRETVQVPFESKTSQVVGGDFTPQSSEMGTFKYSEPASGMDVGYWETDLRNPQMKRGFAGPPMYGTAPIVKNDTASGLLLSDLVGPSQPAPAGLPVGIPNNYSQRPRVVDVVERTMQEVPLPTKSARDAGVLPLTGYGEGGFAPLLQAPVAPAEDVFSMADLFNLKKSVANKAYNVTPDAVSGMPITLSKKGASQVEQALYGRIKNQVSEEAGQQKADEFLKSIIDYSQLKKNKGGFKKLEKLAEKEAGWKPNFGVTNVRDALGFIPPSLITSGQTEGGMIMMNLGKNIQPWAIKTGTRAVPTYLMNNQTYEQ